MGPARRREAVAEAERVLGAPVPRRRELHPAVGGADARRRSASTGSCGAATTRTRKSSSPVLAGGIAAGFAGVDPVEVQMMVGWQRGRALRLRPRGAAAARRGDRPDRRRGGAPAVARRLPRGFAEVPGVLGSAARHALTTHSSQSLRGEHRMSVDERTRVDGEIDAVDPDHVLRGGAARRRSNGSRTCSRRRWSEYAPRPLVVDVDGDAWTLAVDDGVVRSCAGRDDDAPTVLRTTRAQLDDLVNDQVTVVGMQTNGIARPTGRPLRRAARLVVAAARRARRACTAHAGCDRPRRCRRRAARARPQLRGRRAARRDGRLPPARRATSTSPACSTRARWPRCRATWTPPRPRTRVATAGRGGRRTAPATTCSCACSTSTRCRPRSSGWSVTTACSVSPASPATTTSTAA